MYNSIFRRMVIPFGAAAAMIAFICGCAEIKATKVRSVAEKEIKRIAVLPFENFTKETYANEKLRRAVISDLISGGIAVIEPGEVTRVMDELKIRPQGLNVKEIQEIGKALGMEYLLTGSVGTYGISKGVSVFYPEISLNLVLVETSGGTIVRSVSQSAGGAGFWTKHFGVEGDTLSETEREIAERAIDLLFH